MRFKRVLRFALSLSTMALNFGAMAEPTTNEAWTVRRFQREFCGDDSWEPFNRAMFGVFDWCMECAVDPFCRLYSSILPKPLIKGIDNFSENLEYPDRLVSNLLMAEWRPAWDETRRFIINSTIGVGGLFDPADEWFYIFDSGASLSDAFAFWDIPAGPQLALPFMPRATIRGHVGYILDYGLDPKTYFDYICPSGIFIGYSWCLTPNKAPVWRGTWESVFMHASDGYAFYMPVVAAMNEFNLRQFAWRYYEGQFDRAYALLQAKKLPEGSVERASCEKEAETLFHDVRPPVHAPATRPEWLRGEWRDIPGYAPRSPALDSFRALCFAPLGDDDFWWERRSIFNRDFSNSIDEREVILRDDLPAAAYSFVQRPETEGGKTATKLVIVLPGIGAGRTASEAVAMAEFLHAKGYAVVICDSLFHWEHVRSVNRGILPGNITEDARRFADYLGRVIDDLKRDELIVDPAVSIIGWSMGGLTVAHFAALDDSRELPFRVKCLVAINPPASMEHSLKPFDAVVERSRNWTKADAHEMFVRAAPSLYGWASQDHPRYDPANPPLDTIGDPWNYAPNLTDEQANFLLGQTLRVVFPTLVAEQHRIAPFPWIKSELTWFHRNDFYDEIGDVSMREYITKYVPTCYDGVTSAEMISTADIRRLGDALGRNAKLSVLHTWDDPLETDDDRRWFDETFAGRITWFAVGGHCGLFYTKPFQDELLRRLEDSP